MSDEQGYNGWKNYETWLVALHVDNGESTYSWSRELAAERTGDRVALADALKDGVESMRPEMPIGMFDDMLTAAFSKVDWYEIADNYLSELVTP